MLVAWYTVRVDRTETPGGDGYKFVVASFAGDRRGEETIALDSVPGLIGIVRAESPAHACVRTWEKELEEMSALLHDRPPGTERFWKLGP